MTSWTGSVSTNQDRPIMAASSSGATPIYEDKHLGLTNKLPVFGAPIAGEGVPLSFNPPSTTPNPVVVPTEPLILPVGAPIAAPAPIPAPAIEINLYDNDVTRLYKIGALERTPEPYMIFRPYDPSNPGEDRLYRTEAGKVYDTLENYVYRYLLEGRPSTQLWESIHQYNSSIKDEDVIMTYYGLQKSAYAKENVKLPPDFYLQLNEMFPDTATYRNGRYSSGNEVEQRYGEWIRKYDARLETTDRKRLISILEIQNTLRQVDTQQPALANGVPLLNFEALAPDGNPTIRRYQEVFLSPININSAVLAFTPTFIDSTIDRPIIPEDGIDIFNQMVVSKYVPFICYNDSHGRPWYKVFTGGKDENAPNFKDTILPPKDIDAVDTIYIQLWLGDPTNDGTAKLKSANKDSFFKVVYNLKMNTLILESPIGVDNRKHLVHDEEITIARAQSAFPTLNLGPGREAKVKGEFTLWNMDFEETSFLHMVLLDPVLNVYLYVEESMTPYAWKHRLDVHYRSIFSDEKEGQSEFRDAYISNSASVSMKFTPKVTFESKPIIITRMDPTTHAIREEEVTVAAGIPYIQIGIYQAESRPVVENFLPIFRLLMSYYYQQRDPIIKLYIGNPAVNPALYPPEKQFDAMNAQRGWLPELKQLPEKLNQKRIRKHQTESSILDMTKKSSVSRRGHSTIVQLREQAPELFVNGYARRCQREHQPIVVTLEEAHAWANGRPGPDGIPTVQPRQVLEFPRENPKWYIVCPTDENPYPGVKYNKRLPNKDQFPYIPCCFPKDQMSAGARKTKFRDYMQGIVRTTIVKADNKITTNKIVPPYRFGTLPKAIDNILRRYTNGPRAPNQTMDRYGVMQSPSSLIHAVCLAIDDPQYVGYTTDAEREMYVVAIRTKMAATLNPSLFKQEMYDYTEAEILRDLGDGSIFLDPSLFYRAVEEYFRINVYIFTPTKDEVERGSIDIPRFKIFFARAYRPDRPTVVLLKTEGADSDGLTHPQCEIIVDHFEKAKQIVKMFGVEMTQLCHRILEQSLETITWNIVPNANPRLTDFQARSNLYYSIDHRAIFKFPAVSQFVDANGKMRALTLDIQGTRVTIVTLPSQPENLPATTELARISAPNALRVLGEPSGASRRSDGLVDGLWFPILDLQFGEYIPIVPTSGMAELPSGPVNPLEATGSEVTTRLSALRKTLTILVQILRWGYEIARSEASSRGISITPKDFQSLFLIENQSPVEDSASYYRLQQMPRRLPTELTVEASIRKLAGIVNANGVQSNLFIIDREIEGRMVNVALIMYSPKFGKKMLEMLEDFAKLHNGIPPKPILYLDNFYQSDADFVERAETKVFAGTTDLEAWVRSVDVARKYDQHSAIRKRITIGMGSSPEPYLYQDPEGKIYLIQNTTVIGARNRALTISQRWLDYKTNIGFDPVVADTFNYGYMMYGISPDAALIPIQDFTNGEENPERFMKIIYYGSQNDFELRKEAKYAAMMEIL